MVLVVAEQQEGKFKKATEVALTAGKKVAEELGVQCVALVLGSASDPAVLGTHGADKALHVNTPDLDVVDSKRCALAIADIAQKEQAKLVILSHTSVGKSILGRLAVRLQSGVASGNSQVGGTDGKIQITRSAFSGKAIESCVLEGAIPVVSIMSNAIPAKQDGSPCAVESREVNLPEASITVKEVKRMTGTVPLPEAELVVSAGRGMKDPSNWGIIEELAKVLGATTACSRPVADSGWRPHHEHVGQTGIAIRPNLYIAIGISGAIQHLAGVNNSKVIVVINKDPDAPFFKAADYGVCADLFEVVPKFIESLKKAGIGG
jgi:electron transfer flavoprotein alpha subunit